MLSRALVVLLATVAAVAAAGCGAGRHEATSTTGTTTTTASQPVAACKLNAGQRRAVALALRDIRRMHQIQAPLHRFSERGTPAQEAVTGRFLADMSSAKRLPVNVRAHLLHLAKSATGLCGLCFQGLEAEEPVLSTRTGETRCG